MRMPPNRIESARRTKRDMIRPFRLLVCDKENIPLLPSQVNGYGLMSTVGLTGAKFFYALASVV